jgi:hypothetical protein
MPRSTGFSAFFSLVRASLASAIVMVAVVSCSDNMAPKTDAGLDPNSIHLISVPESEKEAYYASLAQSPEMSGNVVWGAPVRVSASVLASGSSCSSGGDASAYTKAAITFAPESDPINAVALPRDGDDGYIADLPIGFDFNFYGNTYNKLNLYLNGFVTFGTAVAKPFYATDGIPVATTPNNMIALAWTDWYPGKVPGSLRYETRGTAPNRRFLIQFRGVPEVSGTGKLTALLVLSEGTNDIAIYTTQFNMTYIGHRMTQGIENADGTLAVYDSARTPSGLVTPRVRGVFTLTNDALHFSPLQVRDVVPPSITPHDNIVVGNDPGLASAVVAVVAPDAADDFTPVTLSSARSDGASIDAPYPVGITRITWTAKDEAGNASTATQTVTVEDREAPVFAPSALSVIEVNATSPSGASVTYNLRVTDNVAVTSVSCEPASGSTFPVGTTLVNCIASDAAGNTSSRSFSVNVIGAHEQLFNLLAYVTELGLPNGTAQPLINQLRAAYSLDGSASACKKMSDFISMVEKKGSSLSSTEIEVVVTESTRIMDAMGCLPAVQTSSSAKGFLGF